MPLLPVAHLILYERTHQSWCRYGTTTTLPHCLWEHRQYNHLGKSFGSFYEAEHLPLFDTSNSSAILPPTPAPQEQCKHTSARSLVERMFQAALCTIASPGNSPNAPYQVNGRQNCAVFLTWNTTQQQKRNDLGFPQQWIKSETLCKETEGAEKSICTVIPFA